jgi:spore coat polysaccharide biosynthesis protein SpsF (cytidylyltransferase family)
MNLAVITVRSNSTRLPDKFSLDILGKPMMVRVYEQVRKSKHLHMVVVACPFNDYKVIDLCKEYDIPYYEGSENDICSRLCLCAKNYLADWVVRIWGDSPLVDPDTIDDILKKTIDNNGDYSFTMGVPLGQMVSVIKYSVLEECNNKLKNQEDREWFHNYFAENKSTYKVDGCAHEPDRSFVNLSVDTEDDLNRIRKIMRLQEIVGSKRR